MVVGDKVKALIVDSSKSTRKILSSLLKKYEIEVEEAASPLQAIELLDGQHVDFLLFSYHHKSMNGIEFFKALPPKTRSSCVSLLVASNAIHQIAHESIEVGITACFSKLNISSLDTFIQNFAQSKRNKLQGRVLLVEDSPSLSQVYGERLASIGLHCEFCVDAEGAIQRISDNTYDLVITDFSLAAIGDGFSVISAKRNAHDAAKSRIPILAISGLNSPARRTQLLLNGANDFYSKDSSLEEFEIRVKHLLESYQLLLTYEMQYQFMQDLATHDALTKLYNRHYLRDVQQQVISEAHMSSKPLALIVADVDFFKQINDTYGHKIGDEVLAAAGAVFANFFANELCFRIGGEEFLVILKNTTTLAASQYAQSFCDYFANQHLSGLNVTISAGVASYEYGDDFEHLFARADDALSKAKLSGRNQVVLDQSLNMLSLMA
jgi:two-component system, cell cycle response regulator